MRATIAQLAPGDRLSCFHAVYGAAWRLTDERHRLRLDRVSARSG